METQSRSEFETRITERNNGNINGLKGIIAGLGRSAAQQGKSIFSSTYKAGSEDEAVFVDAYIQEEKKLKSNN